MEAVRGAMSLLLVAVVATIRQKPVSEDEAAKTTAKLS